jgi:hypothetical protein
VETGLALIATRPDHLVLLDHLTPGPVTQAERLLLMFSGTLPWEDVRARLTGILPEAGLAEAEAGRAAGAARIEVGKRRIVVVFQAERFSDRQMGFSEKVTPTEAQKARYAEQFELLDWLFTATPVMVEGHQATPAKMEN